MNFQIFPAKPEQAEALSRIALAAKSHWDYPDRWIELWKPELTFSPQYFEQNESWVAETDNIPIAFYTLLEKEGSAWIENLWVSPEFIGQGVGNTLFFHALELSRQRGYKSLQFEADPNALGFYEKMGMRKIGERASGVDGQPRSLPIMEIPL